MQGIDTGMVSYDCIVYVSLETGVAKLLQGLGYLFKAQRVYEHCSLHDKNQCEEHVYPKRRLINWCGTSVKVFTLMVPVAHGTVYSDPLQGPEREHTKESS